MPTGLVTAIAADGVRLAVSDEGEGQPLLLIPGLGATRRVFDPIAPLLRARHRVLVYDPRGVGDSDAGSRPFTMALLGADAVAVLTAAGVTTADVLGASMGGAVAQQLVVSSPESVHRLVLAATAPGGPHAVPAGAAAAAALLGKGARTPADAYRLACTVLYSPHFQRTHQEFIDEQVRMRAAHPVRARVFAAQQRAMRDAADTWDRLREVQAPVLVAHGTADVVTPFENARLVAAQVPRARTRWFDGCGHLFFHERPEESARVIDEFLRD